jgi:hypothetical protein
MVPHERDNTISMKTADFMKKKKKKKTKKQKKQPLCNLAPLEAAQSTARSHHRDLAKAPSQRHQLVLPNLPKDTVTHLDDGERAFCFVWG